MDVPQNSSRDIYFGYINELDVTWRYFEAHHGKGPKDGIEGTIKKMIFRKVLSGITVINNPKKFTEFGNTLSSLLFVLTKREHSRRARSCH